MRLPSSRISRRSTPSARSASASIGRMTRPAQKESERRTLDGVIAALGLRPDQEPEEGEAPDFTMRLSGRLIGVEITAYRSGGRVEDGSPRRAVEAEWEQL